MSPMEQLAKQEYERGYSDGKSDFFAAGVAEGEMRARQRMIANRVAANQHPFAAHGKPITEPVKQEQVAMVVSKCGDPESFGERELEVLIDIQALPYDTPFYASPVERQWVDLTDDELKAALEVHQVGLSVRIGRIAIAAFKDKNK